MTCMFCGSPDVQLGRTLASNGTSHVYYRCSRCGKNAGGSGRWLKYAGDIASLPVFDNYAASAPPCEVCGEPATELHHWAPRHLFPEDCENWPKAYLCRKHHTLWHQIVTPLMSTIRATARRNGKAA